MTATARPGAPATGLSDLRPAQLHPTPYQTQLDIASSTGASTSCTTPDSSGWEHNDLTAFANRAGVIYLANDTTGQNFTITLEPPPGARFNGSAAE